LFLSSGITGKRLVYFSKSEFEALGIPPNSVDALQKKIQTKLNLSSPAQASGRGAAGIGTPDSGRSDDTSLVTTSPSSAKSAPRFHFNFPLNDEADSTPGTPKSEHPHLVRLPASLGITHPRKLSASFGDNLNMSLRAYMLSPLRGNFFIFWKG
jgi:hypothetical protein